MRLARAAAAEGRDLSSLRTPLAVSFVTKLDAARAGHAVVAGVVGSRPPSGPEQS